MVKNQIPDIVVGRLPRYLQELLHMTQKDQKTTSSQELGERLGISSAQIRKDLSQFGEFGKQGTGYSISYLIEQLQVILKVDKVWDIALIGAGDLGHAIARYQGFKNRGFRVAMVFDNDPAKIGSSIGDFVVQDTANIGTLVEQANIKVAMLTVPVSAAQEVAEALVRAGVRAILNYAPTPLNLPEHVCVQYIDPIVALQHMTYYLG
ncbi:MAG TPA: redox-sensing transcriptional repressor Rex [Anaerolineaceae bacterium]|nr:redox-sensing transcriptional repressor Rex [Anaerolineaceae bacterium]